MQMEATPRRWGLMAFLYGGIAGVVLGILQVVSIGFIPNIGIWIALLLGLAAPFVIGILVAKQAGKVRAATVSGLWMALGAAIVVIPVAAVIMTIAGANGAWAEALNAVRDNPQYANVDPKQLAGAVVITLIVFGILYLIAILGGGAGLGALGGLIGRSQSPYVQSPYPGGYYPPAPPPPMPYPPTSQPYTEYPPSQGPEGRP